MLRSRCRNAALLGLTGLTLACAPQSDWREVRPEGTALRAAFPCKPASHARPVALAGALPRMTMLACSADEMLFAVGFVDVVDPALVTPALQQLRAAALRNIGSERPIDSTAAQIPGMTPNAEAQRWQSVGNRPDGVEVREELAVFAHGTQVFQASVIGTRVDRAAANSFFAGLRISV